MLPHGEQAAAQGWSRAWNGQETEQRPHYERTAGYLVADVGAVHREWTRRTSMTMQYHHRL